MRKYISFLLMTFLLSGCVSTGYDGVLDTDNSQQLALRQMQTRYFDTADKLKTLENVMATLQDLGFVIDKASSELGSVSATKLSGYVVKMTVSVVPRGTDRMMVRANAQLGSRPVEDPYTYQQFFEALAKSMFLQAHVEE